MHNADLPGGWRAGEVLPPSQIYDDPAGASSGEETMRVVGYRDGDPGHRLYELPAGTPVGEVVRVFRVGSHASGIGGCSGEERVALVAQKAEAIAALVPSRVVFADAAGLKLRFLRAITDEDLGRMEALFSDEEMMDAGLERYLSAWDGKGPLLGPVRAEGVFHFWWD